MLNFVKCFLSVCLDDHVVFVFTFLNEVAVLLPGTRAARFGAKLRCGVDGARAL